MFGQRALWSDGWKAIADHTTGEPYEQDIWRLYDLRTDLSEARDLAAEHPDRLERLQREWWEEAERYGVLPLDDRPMGELLDLASNRPIRELRLWAEQSPITWDLIPRSASQVIQAVLDIRSTDANGVILSRGGESGGMALFLLEGTVVFEHNILGEPHRLITPFRVGPATVIVTADIDLLNDGSVARLTVGDWTESTEIPFYFIGSFRGFEIGRNSRSAVSGLYRDHLPFAISPNTISDLRIKFRDPGEPLEGGRLDRLPPQ